VGRNILSKVVPGRATYRSTRPYAATRWRGISAGTLSPLYFDLRRGEEWKVHVWSSFPFSVAHMNIG
jgi:hypothetical protein